MHIIHVLCIVRYVSKLDKGVFDMIGSNIIRKMITNPVIYAVNYPIPIQKFLILPNLKLNSKI